MVTFVGVPHRIVKVLISIILFGSFVHGLKGQEKDSVFSADTGHARRNYVDWQGFLEMRENRLDSIKREQAWERLTPHLHEIDIVIADLENLYQELNDYHSTLSEPLQNSIVTDTTGVLQLELQDSARFRPRLRDTLESMLNETHYLMKEVEHQLLLAKKLRAEIVAKDTSGSKSESWIPRLKKVADKNLAKDGFSIPFLSIAAWHGQFLLLLISGLYFNIIYKLGRTRQEKDSLPLHKNQPLYIPILKTFMFFLVLFPLSYPTLPIWTLELIFLLAFGIMYMLLYAKLSRFKRNVMNVLFIYYILLIFTNLFLHEGVFIQACAIVANIVGIILLWNLGKKTDSDNPIGFLPTYIVWALIGCHLISVLLNVFGYLNIARIASLTATLGVVHALSLRTFRDMVLHDLTSKFEQAKPESFIAKLNPHKIYRSLDRLILFCSLGLVTVVILANLHLSTEALRHFRDFLQKQFSLGGLKIEYGDFFTAAIVVWLANKIQRSLGTFFAGPNAVHRGSAMTLLPLFRLLIVILGLLFALRVLGLGVDKLTVIIGALSVGIGLGLQNIVNNFVSGIILIFEKPFKLGDYVELGDKKGLVTQIGIRSSTLHVDSGARVVIPNGDLLSGRLVNWTKDNYETFLNLSLFVEEPIEIDEWKKELITLAKAQPEVDEDAPVRVTTVEVESQRYLLSIQVSIRSDEMEVVRGRYLEAIKGAARTNNIKISSIT